MISLHPSVDATNVYVPKSSSPNGAIVLVNELPIDTPSLKTSVTMGCAELDTEHDNDTFASVDDEIVTSCPHITDTESGVIIGGPVGSNIYISSMTISQ